MADSLPEAVHRGDLTLVKQAVESGADPNHMDEDGFTPVMLASARGYLDQVQYLIRQRADPNIAAGGALGDGPPSETEGQTALHMAAQFGHIDVMSELLLQGCDARIPDAGGWTAAQLAESEDQTEAQHLLDDWDRDEVATKSRIQAESMLKKADEGTKAMASQVQSEVSDMVKQMLEPMQAEMDSMRLQISSLEAALLAEQDSNAAAQKRSMDEIDQLLTRVVLKEQFEEMVDREMAPVKHDLAKVKDKLGGIKGQVDTINQKVMMQDMLDMQRQQQDEMAAALGSIGSPR